MDLPIDLEKVFILNNNLVAICVIFSITSNDIYSLVSYNLGISNITKAMTIIYLWISPIQEIMKTT